MVLNNTVETPTELVFRKKSGPIQIRGSDLIRFGSVLKFCDPKTDPNKKKTDPNGCGSDRIIPHINPDPIRSDSDQIRGSGSDQLIDLLINLFL